VSTPTLERWDWLEAPDGLELIADGGVTSPVGFRAGAAACGLKPSGALDIGVLVCDRPGPSALVDTTSALPAAAVQRNREIDTSRLRGVVVNAGTANAATGSPGIDDARQMAALVGSQTSLSSDEIAVCSTGTIGDRLDMAKVGSGIVEAASLLDGGDPAAFARSICTTDRWEKAAAFRIDGVTLGVAAKGAGMIRPGMATMLAFVTLDAVLGTTDVGAMTQRASAESFNRISVDGQMSPSDTLIVLTSTQGKVVSESDIGRLGDALRSACRWAGIQMVKDGEGAEHAVRIRVFGAQDGEEAELVARAVGESPLVRTAIFGQDPNWGRIEQAVGQALSGRGGRAVSLVVRLDGADVSSPEANAVMALPEYDLDVELGRGEASAELFVSDLTHAYVTLNAEYHT
jgi:glutamate N-acetyltransferase/amino-acid N-acetyltransferase